MPVTLRFDAPACAARMSVHIADDTPAMREGLARLIADECDMVVTGSAATAAELRAMVAGNPPDVLVTDLLLGDADGLALIEELLTLAPKLRIVVFTQQPEDVYSARCLQAGARGFVSKRAAVGTLFRAIRDTAAGGIVLPPRAAQHILSIKKGSGRAGTALTARLTNRELQVFRLVGQALATRTVAAKLGVSVKTVETHRENIKNKLDLGSHAELVARAAQWLRESGGA